LKTLPPPPPYSSPTTRIITEIYEEKGDSLIEKRYNKIKLLLAE
jgi:hypothetical protein